MRIVLFFQIVFLVMLLQLTNDVFAQRSGAHSDLIGADLKQVQQQYRRAIDRGVDSLIIYYADALFYDDQLTGAFYNYQRAFRLGINFNEYQKRNFVHTAKRLNNRSPFEVRTGYFAGQWEVEASISPFCSNSSNEDFAPFVWQDLVVITSSRENPYLEKERYLFTRQPFLNIYLFDDRCEPVDPDFLPENLNTLLHDGPIAIAQDTSLVIVTRNYPEPNNLGIQNLYLAYYTSENGQWSQSTKFPYNDVSYSVQHPYYDDQSHTLYFSSDMPGGHGGFDLYTSVWDGSGWSEPFNLGPEINSIYDEVFPSLSPEGHLIFATNHIETSGGLDLVIYKNGQRLLFPPPFNTAHDDFAISFIDKTSGYFTSNRDMGAFDDNIFYFEITPPEEPLVAEMPVIKPEEDPIDPIAEEALMAGFFVVYFDNDRPNPNSWEETTQLDYAQTYEGFMERRQRFFASSSSAPSELEFFFDDVEKGMQQLEWLASFLYDELKQGREHTITFTAHASPLARSEYNLVLSKRRFVSVENYLMQWNDGALEQFILDGALDYTNNPFGSDLSRPNVSADRDDPANSVYGVEASRERRVTITWTAR